MRNTAMTMVTLTMMTQQYNIDTSNARATRSAIMGVSVYAESNDNIIQAEGNDNIDIIEPDNDDTAIQY